jgi:hypothetical protein
MRASLLALLLIAAPVSAQSLTVPAAVYVSAGQIDAWSTKLGLGYREVNPVGQWLYVTGGRPAFVTGTAAADVATAFAITHLIGHRHPTVARIALYTASAMRIGLAIHNRGLQPAPFGLQTLHPLLPTEIHSDR